ncbi:MAG: hypothetical protein OXI54_14415 [Chloroflexota bacterium]|nr:hypothetical protein [Chloroflexota bacterium]MDE2685319.1 hypothetical protein [Chloroflexota bacterium]
MESAGTISVTPIIVALISSHGIIAVALIAIAFRIGRLPTREEHAALQKEVTSNKEELKADIANSEMRLRADIEKTRNEVLQEIRRSHQQIMLVLANHTHDDNGRAVFTLPPDVELVPAPADN